MNLIIEEISVDDLEGQIEILRTIKSASRIKNSVEKIDYKLKKSEESLSTDFLSIFAREISSFDLQKVTFRLNKQPLIKRLFKRNTKNDLINLVVKNSEKCSWIISPDWLCVDLNNKDFSNKPKIISVDINKIYMGNYNSVTLLRKEDAYHFIQNDSIYEITII